MRRYDERKAFAVSAVIVERGTKNGISVSPLLDDLQLNPCSKKNKNTFAFSGKEPTSLDKLMSERRITKFPSSVTVGYEVMFC